MTRHRNRLTPGRIILGELAGIERARQLIRTRPRETQRVTAATLAALDDHYADDIKPPEERPVRDQLVPRPGCAASRRRPTSLTPTSPRVSAPPGRG